MGSIESLIFRIPSSKQLAEEGRRLWKLQQAEREKYPSCSSSWDASVQRSEVFCSPAGEEPRVPRLFRSAAVAVRGSGDHNRRCACVPLSEALQEEEEEVEEEGRFRVYPNCGIRDSRCVIPLES